MFTAATHDRLSREGRTFSRLIASSRILGAAEVNINGSVTKASVQLVSDNYFEVLGVRPFAGRVFEHPPTDLIAVISERFWHRQYGGDMSALGTRLRYGTHEFIVAGVAARGFRGIDLDMSTDVWVPLDQIVPADDDDRIRGRWMQIMGRLPDGVSPAQADAEASAILGRPVSLEPAATGYSRLRHRLAQPLPLVGLGVGLVLLLVGQVALCTALLVLADVFVRTVQNLRGQDAGYLEDRLLIADVEFPRSYPAPRRDQLIEDLRTRAATLPGVEIAAFSHAGQLSGFGIEFRIEFPEREDAGDPPLVMEQRVSPGFLPAMGTPFLAGRDFGQANHAGAPSVAIVNEAFARRFLGGRDPIGARFFRRSASAKGQPVEIEIVGIVGDARWINLRDDPPAMYYRPYVQVSGAPAVRLVMRTLGIQPVWRPTSAAWRRRWIRR